MDVDPFPRAILSKVWSYNLEHNLPPTCTDPAQQAAALIRTGNGYFCGTTDPIGAPAIPYNFGGVAMAVGTASG